MRLPIPAPHRHPAFLLSLLAGLLLPAGPAWAARQVVCHPADEAEVTALVLAWGQALQAGDVAGAAARYARTAELRAEGQAKPLRRAATRQRWLQALAQQRPELVLHKHHVALRCNGARDIGSLSWHLADGTVRTEHYQFDYEYRDQRWWIRRQQLSAYKQPL